MKTIKIISVFIATAAVALFAQPSGYNFWDTSVNYGLTTEECFDNPNCIWELCEEDGCNVVRSGGHWFSYGDDEEVAGIINKTARTCQYCALQVETTSLPAPLKGTDTLTLGGGYYRAAKNEGIGGCTTTDWPGLRGNVESDDVSADWFDLEGCITFKYKGGTGYNLTLDAEETCTYAYPFAGIGFNWKDASPSGVNEGRVAAPDVVVGKTGVKVFYKIESAGYGTHKDNFQLEFATCALNECDNNKGTETNFAEFSAAMRKTAGYDDCWSSGCNFVFGPSNATPPGNFSAASWGRSIPFWNPDGNYASAAPMSAAKANVGLKFKWAGVTAGSVNATTGVITPPAVTEQSAKFCVKKIEWLGAGVPVLQTHAGSPIQMNLAGKTLMFAGLAKNATLELINLQGALVAKENIGPAKNSINVSRLNSGIYIVKIRGEGINLTQKIILK
jgi:hypothetical protein